MLLLFSHVLTSQNPALHFHILLMFPAAATCGVASSGEPVKGTVLSELIVKFFHGERLRRRTLGRLCMAVGKYQPLTIYSSCLATDDVPAT